MEQEELDNELLNVPAAAALPSVPSAEPAAKVPSRAPPSREFYNRLVTENRLPMHVFLPTGAKVEDDDDDMKELAAWAS